MELAGFLNKLTKFSNNIDIGRKGLATDGEEHRGRVFYERGIAGSLKLFQQAKTTSDPQIIILSELVFLQQELQFCHESDSKAKSSLTQAIQSFEDALRCLKIVEDKKAYRAAEATHPTSPKYRIQGFPIDAVHLACNSHRTRLHNILRAPGINIIEKAVLEQRAANLAVIQAAYIEKQRKVLGNY